MLIIGCDYHPSFQQIAFVNSETGELGERRLVQPEEARQFYRELKEQNLAVRVGMESTHQQTRQRTAALSVSGSGAGHSTKSVAMAK